MNEQDHAVVENGHGLAQLAEVKAASAAFKLAREQLAAAEQRLREAVAAITGLTA